MRTALWLLLSLTALVGTISAQGPTIDPAQTVNPATGEMSFSLPLGVVKGVGGHDFPIAIGYRAGIQTYQSASPVGLGFSYGAGSITRSDVFVPDNKPGLGVGGFFSFQNCHRAFWLQFVTGLISVVVFVIGIIAMCIPGGQLAGAVLFYVSLGLNAASLIINAITYTPADYIAGGHYQAKYDYQNSPGKGYFVAGGQADLPDRYFLSTPYLNGEMIPTGTDGSFVLKQSSGSSAKAKETVKILYDITTETWVIRLPDGTRLFFGAPDYTESYSEASGFIDADNNSWCSYGTELTQSEPAASQWNLIKVLFPDYSGTEQEDCSNLSSGWISFEYGKIDHKLFQYYPKRQVSERDVVYASVAVSDMHYLTEVRTPSEKAVFSYSFDRLDSRMMVRTLNPDYRHQYWYQDYLLPRLTDIQIKTKDNVVRSTIEFDTDYLLRANTLNAVTVPNSGVGLFVEFPHKNAQDYLPVPGATVRPNPDRKSLTLEKITIHDLANTVLLPIVFNYNATTNYSLQELKAPCPEGKTIDGTWKKEYIIEERDLWGYYSPATPNADYTLQANNFNLQGNYENVKKSSAWSLQGVSMPNGMSISWEYEPNRYSMANNQPVTSTVGQIRFGGGIRVKSYSVTDGLGKNYKRSFFYTKMAASNIFEEQNPDHPLASGSFSVSSGHATVEPFPYMVPADQDKYRLPCAKGGFYTPAKVAYERTVVVDDYKDGATVKAPNGFTVYDYITSKEFPNVGTYGEGDNSWKRGMVQQITQYNSKNSIVASQYYDYKFEESEPFRIDQILSLGQYVDHRYMNIGVVRLLGVRDMVNNVTSIKSLKSSVDINGAPDRVGATRTVFQVSNRLAIRGGDPNPGCRREDYVVYYRRDPALATMRPVGRFEPELNQLDIVSVIPYYEVNPLYIYSCGIQTRKVYLDIRMVKGADMTNRNGLTVNWSNVKKFDLATNINPLEAYPVCHFRGIGMFDVDNEGVSDDLVINYLRLVDGNNREKHIVFNDISINSSNDVTYSNSPLEVAGFYSIPVVSNPPFPVAETWESTCSYKDPDGGYSSCVGIYQDNLIVVNKFKDNYYGDYDGQPNQIVETNSNRAMRVTVPKPAYWEDGTNGSSNAYLDMKNKNMLTQPCQNVTYYIPSGTVLPIDPTLWKQNVVSASATKWAQFDGRWLPSASYVWKADKIAAIAGAEPTTSIDFADFNHTPNASNPNWQLTGTIDKYSAASDVLQTTNALGISSTTIYSNDNVLPIASVANAKYGECLFTNFTETDIGVAVGSTASMTSATGEHLFSGRAAKITGSQGTTDQYARSQLTPVNTDIPALGSKTFVIDFWAKSSLPSTTSFIHLQSESDRWSSDPLFTVTNIWKKFSVTCTFPDNVTDKKYRVVLRPPATGPGNFTGGTIFYDDVRVYPKTALMTTTYYSPVLRQPVVSIDANNNPGQLVTYDGFGRPIEWRKIDKSNPAVMQLVSKKDYRLMGPGPYPLANTKFIMNYPSITFSWDGGYLIPSVNVKYTVKAMRFVGGDGGFEGTITAPGSQKQVSLTIASPTYPGSGWYYWTITAEAADGSAIVTARGEMGFAVSSAQYNN